MATIDFDDPENMLVAAALVSPELAAEAANYVSADDIESQRLRIIWKAIVDLINDGSTGERINALSIADKCAKGKEARHAITVFCGELMDAFPRFTSLISVATRVHKRATMRFALEKMRTLAIDLKDQLGAYGGEVEHLEERLTAISVAVSQRTDHLTMRSIYRDKANEVSSYFDSLLSSPLDIMIPTGLSGFDKRLGGGLRPGQFHAVLGCTGSGKTALASQICDSAIAHGKRALMFSMEVDPIDVFIRDVERRAGRSRWDLRKPQIAVREAAVSALVQAQSALLSNQAMKVVYGEPMSLEGIRQAILTEQLRVGNIDLVAVDHAQVVAPSEEERRGMPRYLAVKSIAEGLRSIARHLHVAVLCTAQMNPPPKGERPQLSLVRESKDIVNCAEVAVMIWHEKEESGDGVTFTNSWILADKVRAGSEGRVRIRYRGECFRFEDIADEEE